MVTPHGKHLEKLLEKIGMVTKKKFEAEIAKQKDLVKSKEQELRKIQETMAGFLPLGLETRTSNAVSNIYHYRELYRCFKDNPAKREEYHEKLRIQLKSLFRDSEIKKRFGYKYKGREKVIYSLDEVRKDLQLEEIMLLMQYENEKEAKTHQIIYEKIEQDKKKNPSAPNIPETIQINEFSIMQEIINQDTFTLLLEKIPQSRLPREYKKKLGELIVKKHLEDSAYFITENFGFELEPSQCEQKLIDTFGEYVTLSPSEEKKIREIGKFLDSISNRAFPDATLWNTKLWPETESLLLEKVCSEERMVELLNKGLFHYDKNNLKKQTFLFDDFIQLTDNQALHLDESRKQELQKYLINVLFKNLEDAEQKAKHVQLWRFYRNFRSYYWQGAGKLPGPTEAGKNNYLKKSYIGAYAHVNKSFPSELELRDINPNQLKELVLKMQAAH